MLILLKNYPKATQEQAEAYKYFFAGGSATPLAVEIEDALKLYAGTNRDQFVEAYIFVGKDFAMRMPGAQEPEQVQKPVVQAVLSSSKRRAKNNQ